MAHKISLDVINKALEELHNNALVPQAISSFIQGVIKIQQSNPPMDIDMPASTVSQDDFLNGQPLYTLEEFTYDPESTARILGQLIALLAQDATHGEKAKQLKVAIEDGSFQLKEAMDAYIYGKADFFQRWNTKLQLDSSLLLFLIQSSLTPSFEACAQHITAQRSLEGWSEQHCPCCGSDPFIAYWLDSVGKQHNICSFCRTEYRVARMQCTYCGESDTEKLRYISTEELPNIHIQTCSSCKAYIKILERKGQSSPLLPAIDDVSTLVIDVVAKEQGFHRPVPSAFGF